MVITLHYYTLKLLIRNCFFEINFSCLKFNLTRHIHLGTSFFSSTRCSIYEIQPGNEYYQRKTLSTKVKYGHNVNEMNIYIVPFI